MSEINITSRFLTTLPGDLVQGTAIRVETANGVYTVHWDPAAYGDADGLILTPDGNVWKALLAGPAGTVLTSGGPNQPLSWQAGVIADDSITEPKYGADSVSTRALAPGSVTSSILADKNVTAAKVEDIAAATVMGRRAATGAGPFEQLSASEILDFIAGATAPGSIVQRGATEHAALAIGSPGQVPTVNSAGNALEYQTPAGAVAGPFTVAVLSSSNPAWPVPAGIVEMFVFGWAGGASGAAGGGSNGSGAGGGAGGYFGHHYSGPMDAILNVQVGAGGASQATPSGSGNPGTATTVSGANLGTLTANPGLGANATTSAYRLGGIGGTAAGGNIQNISGQNGWASPPDGTPRAGGDAANGGLGGQGDFSVAGGFPAGGGAGSNPATSTPSGAGGDGLAIIMTR